MTATTVFPGDVLDLLSAAFKVHFYDDPVSPLPARPLAKRFTIVQRPVMENDPALSIGVYAADWRPSSPKAWEIGMEEPTLQQYQIEVQLLVRGGNQIQTRDESMTYNKLIRAILYRDPNLRVPLQALSETFLGATERFQRFNIDGQRFLNAKMAANFAYLSTTICTLETETSI